MYSCSRPFKNFILSKQEGGEEEIRKIDQLLVKKFVLEKEFLIRAIPRVAEIGVGIVEEVTED